MAATSSRRSAAVMLEGGCAVFTGGSCLVKPESGLIHTVVRGAALPRPIWEDRVGHPDEGEPRWEYISVLMSR